jgi:hypothetical protein
MDDLLVKRLINEEWKDVYYAIYESGHFATPLAIIPELAFKRFVEECQIEIAKPKLRFRKG